MTNTPLRKTTREAHKISKCDSNGVTNKILERIMSMHDKMSNIFPFFEHLNFQFPLFPKLDKSEGLHTIQPKRKQKAYENNTAPRT